MNKNYYTTYQNSYTIDKNNISHVCFLYIKKIIWIFNLHPSGVILTDTIFSVLITYLLIINNHNSVVSTINL